MVLSRDLKGMGEREVKSEGVRPAGEPTCSFHLARQGREETVCWAASSISATQIFHPFLCGLVFTELSA